MRKKIFKNMCLLALVTILLSSLLVTIVYYANSDARMKSEVREETRFVRGRWSSPARITLPPWRTRPTASP